jgi:arylsulfatase A-like enzyme
MYTNSRTAALLVSVCGLLTAHPRSVDAQQAQPEMSAAPPNILLIIGDDMGVETLASFGVGAEPAATPTLDQLAASGVRFNNFWSQPVCSPTRATLITGRYGFRTGVGRPTGDGRYAGPMPETPPKPAGAPAEGRGGPPGAGARPRRAAAGPNAQADSAAAPPRPQRALPPGGPGLPLEEFTLPKAFAARPELGYSTAAIGKWHLADRSNGWAKHPNLTGFDYFAGLVRGFPEGYFAWIKDVNGELSGKTGYTPDDKINDAIQWIGERGERPWFLWLAFNLPHQPLHLPPKALWVTDHSNIDPQADPDADPRPHFAAMIEAMDTEIGRLLDSLDPSVRANTYIIFMGDNGSTRQTVSAPFAPNHAKGTVYEGGVNVPLIVAGPGVARNRASDALVNSVDMFATIIEMAKIDPGTAVPADDVIDSVSFLPYLSAPDKPSIRDWIYADTFTAEQGVEGGQYAIRNDRYKLVVHNGQEELYDLKSDRSEKNNLLTGTLTQAQQAAHAALRAQVDTLHASEKKKN